MEDPNIAVDGPLIQSILQEFLQGDHDPREWIVEEDEQLTSSALSSRFKGTTLSQCKGFIRLVIRNLNLNVVFGEVMITLGIPGFPHAELYEGALSHCDCLLSVDLSGCVNLKSIGNRCFESSKFLENATLPDGLRIIDEFAFASSGLKSIVFPSSVRHVGKSCFHSCLRLEKVSVRSDVVITFGEEAFCRCPRLVELADAAGFPSALLSQSRGIAFEMFPWNRGASLGDGVGNYLVEKYQCSLRLQVVLVAYSRFNFIVQNADGTEAEKVAAAIASLPEVLSPTADINVGENFKTMIRGSPQHSDINVGGLFKTMIMGGGLKGVLGEILDYVSIP